MAARKSINLKVLMNVPLFVIFDGLSVPLNFVNHGLADIHYRSEVPVIVTPTLYTYLNPFAV